MARFLAFLLVLAGLVYGVYWYFEKKSGGAVEQFTKEVSGEQLMRGKRAISRIEQKMEEQKAELVRSAIKQFQTQTGSYPSSLNELVDRGYLQSVPSGLNYDPSTGTVSVAQ